MKDFLVKIIKKTLSLFPPTWPLKTYNFLIKLPILKSIINHFIKIATPDIVDIGDGKLIFNKEDPVMTGWVSFGSFEPETVKLFRQSLKKDMVIVDIGANIGYYSVIASNRVGPNGKVFAYEPDNDNFAFLNKNIEINKLTNTIPIMTALSDSIGERDLYIGDKKCTTHAFSDNMGTGVKKIVHTDTLDNSLQKYGSPIVDIIKIDIEGAEILAIEGMKNTIAKSHNLILFTEFYPKAMRRLGKRPVEYLKRLHSLGFSLYVINENLGGLTKINDFDGFTSGFSDDESVKNIYAVKE